MSLIQWFHRVSLWETASFVLLLLVAMPLKYFAGLPLAVRVVGSAHGALFVAYVLLLFVVAQRRGWGLLTIAAGLVASVLPFGPIVFEKRMLPETRVEPEGA